MIAAHSLWLFVLAWLLAFLTAPDLASGMRAEDFVAFDYYGQISWLQVFSRPHLDAAQVLFYRPLSDLATWAVVQTGVTQPQMIHHLLLLLHAAAATCMGLAARSLLRVPFGAALAVVILAAVHPLASTVLLYLDGGMTQIGYGLGLGASLIALGKWRRGLLGAPGLMLVVALASLSFDAGLMLPVLLCALGWILPRQQRSVPWVVLGWLPILLAIRLAVMGTPIGGYAISWTRPEVLAIPANTLEVLEFLLLPLFTERPVDLHSAAMRWTGTACLVGALLLAALAAFRWKSGFQVIDRVRNQLALLVVVLCFALPGAVDLLIHTGEGPLPLAVLGYRLYPGVLAAVLWFGGTLGISCRLPWFGGLLLTAPTAVLLALAGQPFREGNERAGEHCDAIRSQIGQLAREQPASGYVLLSTPLGSRLKGRAMARVFQYGLASSFRPPFVEKELKVYPVFDGMEVLVHEPTLQRVVSESGLSVLRYDRASRQVSREPPVLSEDRPALTLHGAPQPEAFTTVDVSAPEGGFELSVSGPLAGTPQLFLLNRVHPFYVAEKPYAQLGLRFEPDAAMEGRFRLRGHAGQVLEIARRFPSDETWLILERRRPDGQLLQMRDAYCGSNVLGVRLVEARD